MRYKVAQGVSRVEIETLIGELMAHGWEVTGGISVIKGPQRYQYLYTQALIKRDQGTE